MFTKTIFLEFCRGEWYFFSKVKILRQKREDHVGEDNSLAKTDTKRLKHEE